MVDKNDIDPDMSVDAALSVFPRIKEVFIARGMACVGCSVSGFHTLKQAAAVYGIDWSKLLNELRSKIGTIATEDDSTECSGL